MSERESNEFYEIWHDITKKIVTCRSDHTCLFCNEIIERGERAEYHKSIIVDDDGRNFHSEWIHEACVPLLEEAAELAKEEHNLYVEYLQGINPNYY